MSNSQFNPTYYQDKHNFEISELSRCSKDPVYFIRNYVLVQHPTKGAIKLELYPYQVGLIESLNSNEFNITNAPRQTGKTVVCGAFFLWYALFHSEQRVLIGSVNQPSAFNIMLMIQFAYDNLPSWLKHVERPIVHNKSELGLGNGSTILSRIANEQFGRGMSLSKIFLDDFAQVSQVRQKSIIQNFGFNKSVTIASTRSVVDEEEFIKLWIDAIERKSKFTPIQINWFDHPNLNHEFKEQMINRLGLAAWDIEFGSALNG